MAKSSASIDVLVLGDHPAAYFAAALLRQTGSLKIAHATIPGDATPDRLALLNPAFFSLNKILEPLKRKLKLTGLWGVSFHGDAPDTRSEHRDKSIMSYVVPLRDLQTALKALAEKAEVTCREPRSMSVEVVDESGVTLTLGREKLQTRAILLAGQLPPEAARVLAVPQGWPADVLVRQSYVQLSGEKWLTLPTRPVLPMSLDLGGQLDWAWMLPTAEKVQLVVQQPLASLRTQPPALIQQWAKVLQAHEVLAAGTIPEKSIESHDLPLGGALEREQVASRTLLIGPAGGFYSASGEDLYPNCWSALFAVDVLKKALKEPHLQDALQPYRQKWGATLGEYLRGPQQNLRFLMPLIYRNPVMTKRLAESILLGKQVVR